MNVKKRAKRAYQKARRRAKRAAKSPTLRKAGRAAAGAAKKAVGLTKWRWIFLISLVVAGLAIASYFAYHWMQARQVEKVEQPSGRAPKVDVREPWFSRKGSVPFVAEIDSAGRSSVEWQRIGESQKVDAVVTVDDSTGSKQIVFRREQILFPDFKESGAGQSAQLTCSDVVKRGACEETKVAVTSPPKPFFGFDPAPTVGVGGALSFGETGSPIPMQGTRLLVGTDAVRVGPVRGGGRVTARSDPMGRPVFDYGPTASVALTDETLISCTWEAKSGAAVCGAGVRF